MFFDDYWDEDDFEEQIPPDDPAVTAATERLRAFFAEHTEDVYYETQLCVFFEADFFIG